MTKEMLDNDLDTNEYQFFYTKTRDIPTEGLQSKIVLDGTMGDYFDFIQSEQKVQLKVSNETIGSAIQGALDSTQRTVMQTVNSQNFANNAIKGMGIGLIVNPVSTFLLGDDQYVQVTDYFDGQTLKTRVIKFIESDESLPKDERKMIYEASNDRSYHFNRGKTGSLLMPKEYDKFKKTCNEEQK